MLADFRGTSAHSAFSADQGDTTEPSNPPFSRCFGGISPDQLLHRLTFALMTDTARANCRNTAPCSGTQKTRLIPTTQVLTCSTSVCAANAPVIVVSGTTTSSGNPARREVHCIPASQISSENPGGCTSDVVGPDGILCEDASISCGHHHIPEVSHGACCENSRNMLVSVVVQDMRLCTAFPGGGLLYGNRTCVLTRRRRNRLCRLS